MKTKKEKKMGMLDNWETIATLTKKEQKEFSKTNACRVAAKKLIEELVFHWETNHNAEAALWEVIKHKYCPDDNSLTDEEFTYKVIDGKLFRRKVMTEKLENYIKQAEADRDLRNHFIKVFGMEDK